MIAGSRSAPAGGPAYVPPSHELAPPDLAGVWPRIGARILDALLVGFEMGFLRGALYLPGGAAFNLMLLVAMVLSETVLLANGGQTLGKMLLGLRVVRVDRAPAEPVARRGRVLFHRRYGWARGAAGQAPDRSR
jgi:uncharacterized RDD family membrane protein YckC